MGAHDFDRVDEVDDEYVLVCTCGWRSEPDGSAASVGGAWDCHREDVGATP